MDYRVVTALQEIVKVGVNNNLKICITQLFFVYCTIIDNQKQK